MRSWGKAGQRSHKGNLPQKQARGLAATVENSMEVPQKVKKRTTL